MNVEPVRDTRSEKGQYFSGQLIRWLLNDRRFYCPQSWFSDSGIRLSREIKLMTNCNHFDGVFAPRNETFNQQNSTHHLFDSMPQLCGKEYSRRWRKLKSEKRKSVGRARRHDNSRGQFTVQTAGELRPLLDQAAKAARPCQAGIRVGAIGARGSICKTEINLGWIMKTTRTTPMQHC